MFTAWSSRPGQLASTIPILNLRLMQYGYTGGFLSPEDILAGLREDDWLITGSLAQVGFMWMGSPVLTRDGAIVYSSRIMRTIWREAPEERQEELTLALLGNLKRRPDWVLVVQEILRRIPDIFGPIDVIRAQRAAMIIEVWRAAS